MSTVLIMAFSGDGVVPASAAELTVGLLGPLEVTLAGRPLTLTAGRLRTLFAVLALSANEDVSVDRLVTAIWREDPPDTARRTVQTYVTRLRGAVGTGVIRTGAAGYRLCVEPDNVDALRFGRLLNAASAATDLASQRALLVEATGSPTSNACVSTAARTRLHAELGNCWALIGPQGTAGTEYAAVAAKRLGTGAVTVMKPRQSDDGDVMLVRPDAHLGWQGRDPDALDAWLADVLA